MVTTCGLGDVERTRVSIDHHWPCRAPCLDALAVDAIGEPAAESCEGVVPDAFFRGADMVSGTEVKRVALLGERSLRKAYVVIFTACGDICGGFHHKSKSPHMLVAVFATSPNHHKYLWRKPPQVQSLQILVAKTTTSTITTNTCGSFRHKSKSPQIGGLVR